MKIAIIGRGEYLFDTALVLLDRGYEIPLVVTAQESPEFKIKSGDYEELAAKIGAKFMKTPKINTDENIKSIKQLGLIDLAVSINYSGVIQQEVIDLFENGILNVHGGDLPRYRGNACQAWAIINGENHIGLSVHRMIGGELDSGDILEKKLYPININTRIGEVYQWFANDIPELVVQAIDKLLKLDYHGESQSKDYRDALRCYPRLPEDGRINWGQSAENIIRLINASSEPYSGAFAFFENEKVIIWRAELYQDFENYLAIPGQIAAIKDEGIVVITGSGKILITLVEMNNLKSNPSIKFKSIRKRFE